MGHASTPLRDVEDSVLREGRGRTVEMRPELFVERPGVSRYIEITGHRWAVVAPMRVRSRSTGVLWFSAERALDDDVNFLEMVASRLALMVEHARFVERDHPTVRRSGDGPAAQLTDREREILSLVASGMTSRQVADQLVVSIRTVEWHRARLQTKLGVAGRAELTRIAREAGLLA